MDWLCFPRFDSGACFAALLGDESHGRWLLAPTTWKREVSRRYTHDTLILETEWRTDDGRVRVIDFMPPRGVAPDLVRIVEGIEGTVEMGTELVIRFDYGSIVPWVRRLDDETLLAIAGPDALLLADAGRAPRRGHADARRVHRLGRRTRAVRADVVSVTPPAAGRDRPGARARRDARDVERVGRHLRLRGRAPRRRPPVAARAQGADVRADGRHRRRADDLAARSTSAACATGTTATAGCATRR